MKGEFHELLPSEVIRELKSFQFWVRGMVSEGVLGGYRSAFRGRGMEFEEVREYVPGDDVRAIDWKVTARSRKPFIKVFREERDLSVVFCLDVSRSMWTGTQGALRAEIAARVAAVLAFVALQNNDRVGLVQFADKVEEYLPPRRARTVVWKLLRELVALTPREGAGSTATLAKFLVRVLPRRSVLFLLSDFFDAGAESALLLLSRRHDVTGVVFRDPADLMLPPSGIVDFTDPETGEIFPVDCGSARVRREYARMTREREEKRRHTFERLGIGLIEVESDKPFLPPLRRYFDRRLLRH